MVNQVLNKTASIANQEVGRAVRVTARQYRDITFAVGDAKETPPVKAFSALDETPILISRDRLIPTLPATPRQTVSPCFFDRVLILRCTWRRRDIAAQEISMSCSSPSTVATLVIF